jgi:hypothetical protein
VQFRKNFTTSASSLASPGFVPLSFDNWIWTPYLEIVMPTSRWLEAFYSFSAFGFGNSFGKNLQGTFYTPVTAMIDTYLFSSDDGGAVLNNFNSATTPPTSLSVSITGGTATNTGGTTTITGAGATTVNTGGTTQNAGGRVTNSGGRLYQSTTGYWIRSSPMPCNFFNTGGVVDRTVPHTAAVIYSGTQTFSQGELTKSAAGVIISGGTTTNDVGTVKGTPPDISVQRGNTANTGGTLSQPINATDYIEGGVTTITSGNSAFSGGATTSSGGTVTTTGGTTTLSGGTVVTSGGVKAYLLNPNNAYRSFVGDSAIPVIEDLQCRANANVYENRFGVRNAVPLLGG